MLPLFHTTQRRSMLLAGIAVALVLMGMGPGRAYAANGCIDIFKETFDRYGNRLLFPPPFTFRLDGSRTALNGTDGQTRFSDVPEGQHVVTEDADPGWTLLSTTPPGGQLTVFAGLSCVSAVFKNHLKTAGSSASSSSTSSSLSSSSSSSTSSPSSSSSSSSSRSTSSSSSLSSSSITSSSSSSSTLSSSSSSSTSTSSTSSSISSSSSSTSSALSSSSSSSMSTSSTSVSSSSSSSSISSTSSSSQTSSSVSSESSSSSPPSGGPGGGSGGGGGRAGGGYTPLTFDVPSPPIAYALPLPPASASRPRALPPQRPEIIEATRMPVLPVTGAGDAVGRIEDTRAFLSPISVGGARHGAAVWAVILIVGIGGGTILGKRWIT